MTSCSSPPSRPPREAIGRLIDDVARAKTCLLIAAATPPESPERARETEKLREAVDEPRRGDDEASGKGQSLPRDLIVDLRARELAIPKLEAAAVLRQQTGGPA